MSNLLQELSHARPSGPFGPDGWSGDPSNRTIPAQHCLVWERLNPAERQLVNSVAEGERLFAMTCEPGPTGWEVHLWEHHASHYFTVRSVILPPGIHDPGQGITGMTTGVLTGLAIAGLSCLTVWLLGWHAAW